MPNQTLINPGESMRRLLAWLGKAATSRSSLLSSAGFYWPVCYLQSLWLSLKGPRILFLDPILLPALSLGRAQDPAWLFLLMNAPAREFSRSRACDGPTCTTNLRSARRLPYGRPLSHSMTLAQL